MLLFRIRNSGQREVELEHVSGPLILGRRPQQDGTAHYVIHDITVSRKQMLVEEVSDERLRVRNLSEKKAIHVSDGTAIEPGDYSDVQLPAELVVGETTIDVRSAAGGMRREHLETIIQPVRASSSVEQRMSLLQLGAAPSPDTLMRWFETLIAVQRAAAGSPELYEQTARAVRDLVGLDRGLVLLRKGDDWNVVARAGSPPVREQEFSLTILHYLSAERRTFYQSTVSAPATRSLQGVEAVVASPIFDVHDQVVGAVYGSRNRHSEARRSIGVGPLEAQVIQLLASAVGAGLARLEQETEATRLRVLFEQFFSAQLARELQNDQRMLEGQERTVTILFSDIRNFSNLAERLSARDACRLASAVLERFSECVRRFEGVVVDYMGDAMLAMWNAPADQPDHAALACRAAQKMMGELPGLSAEWQGAVGTPLGVGIGLNTGPALVGNTGNQFKFKYGPHGHTVNLASRVESATKQLGIPLLITGSTRDGLDPSFATRRLCRVRVQGIEGAVDLYELHTENASLQWRAERDAYEHALGLYEARRWAEACRALYRLLDNHEGQYDLPSLDLLSRAVQCLKSPPPQFDGVVDLAPKGGHGLTHEYAALR